MEEAGVLENRTSTQNSRQPSNNNHQSESGFFDFFINILGCCNSNGGDNNYNALSDLCSNKDDNEISYVNEMQKELEKNFLLIPKKYIREDESAFINFSVEGILEFISKIQKDNYSPLYEENLLKIFIKSSSLINENINIIRCHLTKPKNLLDKVPEVADIIEAINIPEERIKWDKNLKTFEIKEKINYTMDIAKMVFLKQFSIIGEREIIEKRIRFSDEGINYIFSSSVPEKVERLITPDSEVVVKATNFLGVLVFNEDDDNFYIDSFNQIDIKMGIPQSFIQKSLPNKVKEFFDNLFNYLEKK